ncbi:MAG: T9SS type A sorting domain-containing protein, partial [Bacteroidota bacterium]
NDNYSVAYSQFVVPLVKAVQELSKQNNNLKTENDSQQKQIDELKSMVQQLADEKKESAVLSNTAALDQNQPNPFSQQTVIRYAVPAGFTSAFVEISNISGQLLKTQSVLQSGKGQLILNANELSSGTYQYSLIIDGKVLESKQMILTK